MQSTLPLFANRSNQASEIDYNKDNYRNGDKIASHRLYNEATDAMMN